MIGFILKACGACSGKNVNANVVQTYYKMTCLVPNFHPVFGCVFRCSTQKMCRTSLNGDSGWHYIFYIYFSMTLCYMKVCQPLSVGDSASAGREEVIHNNHKAQHVGQALNA